MSKLDELDAALKKAQDAQNAQNLVMPKGYSKEMNMGMRAFMEMLGVLLGSGLMGWALDAYFNTSPTLLIIFVILGIVAAFYNVYKLTRNLGTAIGANNLQSEEKTARKPSQN